MLPRHLSLQGLVCPPPSCLPCSSELHSLHLKGDNRPILPCQQTPQSSLKPFQWPWIQFQVSSPRLAKLRQLSKLKMSPCTIQSVGFLCLESRHGRHFPRRYFGGKRHENVANLAANSDGALSPGRSFIHFWHCHTYQWSPPSDTWLITKQDSLRGPLGTTGNASPPGTSAHRYPLA